jgi:galactokinase
MINDILTTFQGLYKCQPRLFRSPGRINIIGEHTDYNNGFVLPAAINKEMYFAVAPNTTSSFRMFAYDLNEKTEISTSEVAIQKSKTWSNYLLGVVDQLAKRGVSIGGVDVVVGGTIPIGAGVSSSAAMECGFLFSLNSVFSLGLGTMEMVKMAQMAEHEFAGVKCGIMDQFAVMFGKKDAVMRLDCRSLDFDYESLKLDNYSILLCDTGVKHSLASSEYNNRRLECERGVSVVAKHFTGISSLRDVSLEQLQYCSGELSKRTFDQCSYVIEENIRLNNACKALENNDLKTLGQMIYASHEGLKTKYEVSCPELDTLVEIARSTEGVIGSRMMGGGFGGCTINILHNDALENFEEKIRNGYYLPTGKPENIIKVAISDGTSEIYL